MSMEEKGFKKVIINLHVFALVCHAFIKVIMNAEDFYDFYKLCIRKKKPIYTISNDRARF